MGQVFSFLTGAASITGFRGLGHKYRRKDLLRFEPRKLDPEAMCFEFRRLDNDTGILVKFYPRKVPFPPEKERRLGELLEKVIWEAAKEEERKEFQDLWMEKIRTMVLDRKDIQEWITTKEGG
jgi:hypothetical protein